MLLHALILTPQIWQTYDLDGLKIALPAPPERGEEDIADKKLGVTGRAWRLIGSDGNRVHLFHSTLEEDMDEPDMALAGSSSAIYSAFGGNILSQFDAVYSGWPALDMVVKTEKAGTLRNLTVLAGKEMFTLLAGGGPQPESFANSVIKGLTLSAKLGTGPLKAAGPEWQSASLKPIAGTADFPEKPQGDRYESDDEPGVNYRRLTASYGNRTYGISIANILPDQVPKTPEQQAALLDKMLGGEVKGKEKDQLQVVRSDGSLRGVPSRKLSLKLPGFPGDFTIMAECVMVDGYTITLTACVPTAIKEKSEVRRFFSSLKLGPKG